MKRKKKPMRKGTLVWVPGVIVSKTAEQVCIQHVHPEARKWVRVDTYRALWKRSELRHRTR